MPNAKCQMPKLQSGYNRCVVHTRSTANVVDQKETRKMKEKKTSFVQATHVL